jgi:hypothetical protein
LGWISGRRRMPWRQGSRKCGTCWFGPIEGDASLTKWLREFRKYHRDDKGSGKIVKRDDHLMDATR